MRRSLGVDVAARRGLDLVLLDDDGSLAAGPGRAGPDDLPALLRSWRPAVVAIDAPCAWAPPGERSRAAERALLALGVHCYFTPAADLAGSPFYDWVRTGARAHAACRASGYAAWAPGGGAGGAGVVCEVFPHATVVALGGCVPAPARGAARVAQRRALLARCGVADARLRTADQVDAALAALTGLHVLRGTAHAVGRPLDGYVVLPGTGPDGRYPRGPVPTTT